MKFPIVKFKTNKTNIKGLECLNCGKPLRGDENFCSYCGQKNTTKKLNLGTFINNLFSGFLSYDSRFWTTFIPLLTKPGKVSKDFISGKRARFVNPFQLYLNVSIVFFLILGISNKMENITIPVDEIANAPQTLDSLKQTNQPQIDSILKNAQDEIGKKSPNDSTSTKIITSIDDVFTLAENKDIGADTIPYQYHIKKDSIKKISTWNRLQDFQHYYNINPKLSNKAALDKLGYPKTFWNLFYYQEIINANKNLNQLKEDKGKTYFKKIISTTSISLFVFLPIFTLFLMLLYFRRKYTYIEHLVFVFNTQTVFFLLLSIFYLIGFVINIGNFAGIFILIFLIYLYKALRNFYEQSRTKTIIKLIIINSFYLFLGFIGILIIAAISFVSS
jgi:hypothetical protein